MASITITNLTRNHVIGEGFVRQIVAQTLLHEGAGGGLSLSVVFIGKRKIKSWNLKYHGKDAPTDILSFRESREFPHQSDGNEFIGEIFLCPDVIKKNADTAKISFKKELAHIIIHGVLHLLGYDHERGRNEYLKMHSIEEKIMDRLEIKI